MVAIRYGERLYDLNFHSESDKVSMVELRHPMRKKELGGTEEVEMPRFEILGSCKGFLLIKHDVDLYLWNPSIRQCTKVLSLPRKDKDVKYERRLIGSGLCYDSSTDDYKAVLAYKGDCTYYNGYKGITVVASLKSRRWTTFCLPYKLNSGATVNDRLHWVVGEFPTQQIVCFDPLVDEFAEFSTPCNERRNEILGLGVLDGCLCVVCYGHCGRDTPDIVVLIMKEYGMEESWTRLFVISHFGGYPGCLVPLCLTKNGKVVINVCGTRMLVYNPLQDSRKHITNLTNVFTYEESLVLPDSYGGGYDWKIGRADASNMVYHDHRDRGRRYWCQCCDYVPSWHGINDFLEDNYDRTYDWEEDFLEKGKERLRMRIKNQNY